MGGRGSSSGIGVASGTTSEQLLLATQNPKNAKMRNNSELA